MRVYRTPNNDEKKMRKKGEKLFATKFNPFFISYSRLALK